MMQNPDNDRRDAEFRATITAAYHDLLGPTRDPDPVGMEGWLHYVRLPPDGLGKTGEELRAAIATSPEAIAYANQPKTPPTPRLHVEGLDFVTEDGAPWRMAFVSSFRLFERFLLDQDIDPLLEEAVAVGANGVRVFGAFDFGSPEAQRLYPSERPNYYDMLKLFFACLAHSGLYVQFTAFADTQRSVPGADAQDEHWHRVALAINESGATNVLLERVNENDSHDNRVDANLAPPAGICSSFGSNGQGADPPGPFWDYADLHSERKGDFALSTPTVHFAINGYGATYPGTHRATVVSEPPGFADTLQPGRRTNDPRIAYLMGLGCRWGAGGTAHSDCGAASVPLTPIQRACVEAFLRGVGK